MEVRSALAGKCDGPSWPCGLKKKNTLLEWYFSTLVFKRIKIKWRKVSKLSHFFILLVFQRVLFAPGLKGAERGECAAIKGGSKAQGWAVCRVAGSCWGSPSIAAVQVRSCHMAAQSVGAWGGWAEMLLLVKAALAGSLSACQKKSTRVPEKSVFPFLISWARIEFWLFLWN